MELPVHWGRQVVNLAMALGPDAHHPPKSACCRSSSCVCTSPALPPALPRPADAQPHPKAPGLSTRSRAEARGFAFFPHPKDCGWEDRARETP